MNLTSHKSPVGSPRHSVFRQLLLSMLAFGALVGILFPPFARIVLDTPQALSAGFIAMCIMAGLLVGVVNYWIFNIVVSRQLARIVNGMVSVLSHVNEAVDLGKECAGECSLVVTSDDAIGDIERSYNAMTEAISRRLHLETASRHLGLALSTSVELSDVSRSVLESIVSTCGAAAGVLYGDTGDSFDLLCSIGVDRQNTPEHLDPTNGPIDQALSQGDVVRLELEADRLEWLTQSTPLGSMRPRQMLCVPLMASQRAIGIVVAACPRQMLSADQALVLDTLRAQAAPYLQNAILHRKVTDLAALDDLTRILNRRFGLRRLQEEFSRAVRHGVPLTVVMLDIDHFKRINDAFGHDAGDAVLRTLAPMLETHLRAGDLVCRYGGEEFMIVMPGSGLRDAVIAVERIRQMIENTAINWKQIKISVTVSFGVATWPMAPASVPEELVSAADKALYTAKENGRNRIYAMMTDRPVSHTVIIASAESAPTVASLD